MVKILAPVTSFEAARQVILAGIDEIYCGVTVPGINYEGLAKRPPWSTIPTYGELERVVRYAHEHGVKVMATTEFPFMAELIENKIKRHVRSLVETGIDALIATDIGIILMAKDMGRLNIPICASTYLAPMNYEAVDLLKQLGVKTIVLERHVTINEMRQIVLLSEGVEIEVFVHGPGCSNIDVNCYGCGISFVTGSTLSKQGGKIENLCQTNYEVYKVDGCEETKIANVPILDAYSWCSLCQLPDLVNTGITGIKIVGREFGPEQQADLAKIFRELIDLLERDQIEDFLKRANSLRNNRHFASACQQKRCYYSHLFHAPYKIPVA